jgi:serine/threonine protein kinase
MADDVDATADPDAAQGQAIADALKRDRGAGLGTRKARQAARAGLFGGQPGPTKVDRYFVIELLGSGAMGSVYAAYDPRLDRKVALKILAGAVVPSRGDEATDSAGNHEALLREAQALAQVRHRNVVDVYDAGSYEGQVYLAMELIEGQTLRSWLEREDERSLASTLGMLMQAGRGLAAVHSVGLVHRDFKPDNVLIGKDGVARVADFGLARVDEHHATDSAETTPRRAGSDQTAGAGTPAYLAPERMTGTLADARSDLFSFSVVAFEAFAGMRPYPSAAVLTGNFSEDSRAKLPEATPRWLTLAVERGLDPDPARRQQSVDDLLKEFEAGLAADVDDRRRRASLKRLGFGSSFVVILGLGAYGVQQLDRNESVAECEAKSEEINELWPAQADEVTAGIRSSELSYADETANKLVPLLSAWSDEWRKTGHRACVESTVDKTLPAELLRRTESCLDLRRSEMQALLDLLASGDPLAVQHAIASVTGFPGASTCADRRALEHGSWPSAEQWDEVLAVRHKLTAVSSLQLIGKYEPALEQAQEAQKDAETLGWEPLVARAKFRVGVLHEKLGSFEEAKNAMTDAFFAARRSHADDVAADAATGLSFLLGLRLNRAQQGLLWADHAAVALDASEAGPRQRARVERARAGIHRGEFEFDEATALYQSAIERLEEALGPDHPEVMTALQSFAAMRMMMGELDEARGIQERVVEFNERTLGPHHPLVATSLHHLARHSLLTGDPGRAGQLLERALAIQEAAYGPQSARLVWVLDALGEVKERQNELPEARALLERSVALSEKHHGPDHPRLTTTLYSLGMAYGAGGDAEKQLEVFERALAISVKAKGPDHVESASLLIDIGVVHKDADRFDEALEYLQKGVPALEKILGRDHVHLAPGVCNLGGALFESGRAKESVPYFERCLSIFEKQEGPQDGEARAGLYLARSLVESGGDRTRAVSLARQALSIVDDEPLPDPEDKPQLIEFLEEYDR